MSRQTHSPNVLLSDHDCLQCLRQGLDIPGIVVADTVDEKRRRPVDTAPDTAQEILSHSRSIRVGRKGLLKPLLIETHRHRILREVPVVE